MLKLATALPTSSTYDMGSRKQYFFFFFFLKNQPQKELKTLRLIDTVIQLSDM